MLVIFQVAIGLIFIYSLLSILATSINTLIANLLKLRARTLKRGLMELLTDQEIQQEFLSHPLIRIIEPELEQVEVTRGRAQAAPPASEEQAGGVSYIRPEVFAKVLTDVITEKAQFSLYLPLLTAISQLPASPQRQRLETLIYGAQNTGIGLGEIREEVRQLPDNQQALKSAILNAVTQLETMHPAALTSPGSRLLPLLNGIRQVNNEAFQRALRVIVGSASTLEEAQNNMEEWFNAKMDQLTEAYKRYITYISFVLGLLMALLLNADTLHMARALWEDPALRAAVVAAAEAAVIDEELQEPEIITPVPLPSVPPAAGEPTILPPGEFGAQAATPLPGEEEDITVDEVLDSAEAVADALDDILALNLPIGWEFRALEACGAGVDPRPRDCDNLRNIWLLGPANNPNYWFGILLRKIIGIIITAVAVAQGAPFWFDLLNRLVRRN